MPTRAEAWRAAVTALHLVSVGTDDAHRRLNAWLRADDLQPALDAERRRVQRSKGVNFTEYDRLQAEMRAEQERRRSDARLYTAFYGLFVLGIIVLGLTLPTRIQGLATVVVVAAVAAGWWGDRIDRPRREREQARRERAAKLAADAAVELAAAQRVEADRARMLDEARQAREQWEEEARRVEEEARRRATDPLRHLVDAFEGEALAHSETLIRHLQDEHPGLYDGLTPWTIARTFGVATERVRVGGYQRRGLRLVDVERALQAELDLHNA